MDSFNVIVPLCAGVILDAVLGDPAWLPHPIVAFGKAIAVLERRFNRVAAGGQDFRRRNGRRVAIALIVGTYVLTSMIIWVAKLISPWLGMAVMAVGIFYGLAGTTLVREVRNVFHAADRSLEEGRRQVARIVGRDTSELSLQEVRTAALETLAENLSDGVVAPLFWLMLLGVPGMMAYKMVNTLDSMIGYRNERYAEFGRFAALTDDVFNYIPARLTALLMVIAAGRPGLWRFVRKYGRCHASPNSGYPEAALAGILDCRFGGTHTYFGESFYKPFIGENARTLTSPDMERAVNVNVSVALLMEISVALVWIYL
jgi:adenosylcobinamide-phosphate synthase